MLSKKNASSNDTEDFDTFLSFPFPSLKSDYPACFGEMISAFDEKYNRKTDFDDFLSNIYLNFSSLKSDHRECYASMNSTFQNNRKSTKREDYDLTAWISIWHCIQPFVLTMIVLISINYKKVKSSAPHIPEPSEVPVCLKKSRVCQLLDKLLCCIPFKVLWPLGHLLFTGLVSALLVVVRLVPIPAFTNLYRFYLDVRCHQARSKPDFRTKIPRIEELIREHEAIGKLCKI